MNNLYILNFIQPLLLLDLSNKFQYLSKVGLLRHTTQLYLWNYVSSGTLLVHS